MGRRKIEFTTEHNEAIVIMVRENKSLDEISKELKNKFNIIISLPTLSSHIKSIGVERQDGRKWSGNHKRGYAVNEVVGGEDKAPSPYKLKKYFDGEREVSRDVIKKLGLNKDGIPMFYSMLKGKDGKIEEVKCKLKLRDITFGGGDDCVAGSLRWWVIERMRFDFGNNFRPLLPGQLKGDWRGVEGRFYYDENGFYRFGDVDIVKEQQDAWARFVDARCDYVESGKELTGADMHNNNKYIINAMNDNDLFELMKNAPIIIYKYIPQHLYGAVVCYCIDKMNEDNRILYKNEKVLEAIKKIMSNASMLVNNYEAGKISLEVIKQCLHINPNDFEEVVKMCVYGAINSNLIRKNYVDTAKGFMDNLKFKCVNSEESLEGLEWLSLNDDKLHEVAYSREIGVKKMCDKFGLIF